MKWTIFFMIWLGANPALATVIRYEARDVVFQGPDFYPSIFQNCNATMRFSFDTVSEEVVDSSVTCANLPLHLSSTGRSPITFYDETYASPEPIWMMTFRQEMVLNSDPESSWVFALTEYLAFTERSDMLVNFGSHEGWSEIFAVYEVGDGDISGPVTGYADGKITKVPEPLPVALLALGLLGIGFRRFR
ncbi:exported hypothetical protein [Marinobacter salarius]|uniref:PEP-CTERM sorting domain-containing protein n=1 Tax=Marinobacter salarius TaxID=1420917 RepID=UPI001251867E|nr:PEP-CTERM sorting domain-containing protein [Marinobacter salarius]VVT02878.1 exported hypothetical protein [Marinobacter salarius]VXC24660.1 exported hypothetical protein [Marinobacter salarius]